MAMVPLAVYALNGLTDVLVGYPEATRLLPVFVMGIPLLLAGNRLWAWRAEMERSGSATAAASAGKASGIAGGRGGAGDARGEAA
jgi:hypothetical protein